MIRVTLIKRNGVITEVAVMGHALYDDYGKDIVCAAVSATLISNINGILKLDANYLDYQKVKDGLKIVIQKHNQIVDILVNNMVDCLQDLANQYPKNVKIVTKEE